MDPKLLARIIKNVGRLPLMDRQEVIDYLDGVKAPQDLSPEAQKVAGGIVGEITQEVVGAFSAFNDLWFAWPGDVPMLPLSKN